MRTSELTGPALDWAVAVCEEVTLTKRGGEWCEEVWHTPNRLEYEPYQPSTDWAIGGPIIEREGITIEKFKDGSKWSAFKFDTGDCEIAVATPLIAAMRCYVASRMGDTIDVPEELK